jgi:group I intron endonuclease
VIVYKIENKINGKIYVGQTKSTIAARLSSHLKSSTLMGSALRKYGIESFRINIIDTALSKEILDEKERYWIATLSCKPPHGYNIASGGQGSDAPRTAEAKENLRIKNTGKKFTEEHCRKISLANKGRKRKPFTEETIRKMQAANSRNKPMLGKHHSPESKRKMAETLAKTLEKKKLSKY